MCVRVCLMCVCVPALVNACCMRAQDAAFGLMNELFQGPFQSSPQYAEFARENLGYEVPPMNPDRLAELAEFTAKMGTPADTPAPVGGAGSA